MTKRSILTPEGYGVRTHENVLLGIYENDRRACYEQAEAVSAHFYDGKKIKWATLYRRGWRVIEVTLTPTPVS
jgi:hypothetical protein